MPVMLAGDVSDACVSRVRVPCPRDRKMVFADIGTLMPRDAGLDVLAAGLIGGQLLMPGIGA